MALCTACSVEEHNMTERSGEYIRRVRGATMINGKPLTQRALAKRVGITHPTLSQWERGEEEPADRIVRLIANELDLDADAILRKVEYERFARRLLKIRRRYGDLPFFREVVRDAMFDGTDVIQVAALTLSAEDDGEYAVRLNEKAENRVVEVPILKRIPTDGNIELPPHPGNIDGCVAVTIYQVVDPSNAFGLIATGPNMTGLGVQEGGVIVVDRKQEILDSDDALILEEGQPAIRRVSIQGDGLILQHPNYAPKFLRPVEGQDMTILGKIVQKNAPHDRPKR